MKKKIKIIVVIAAIMCLISLFIFHPNWRVIIVAVSMFMIILFYTLKTFKDKKPLPLADFRVIENAVIDLVRLGELYKKEQNRYVPKSLYLLHTPDEQMYIKWLELQATKFMLLQDNLPLTKIEFPDVDADADELMKEY